VRLGSNLVLAYLISILFQFLLLLQHVVLSPLVLLNYAFSLPFHLFSLCNQSFLLLIKSFLSELSNLLVNKLLLLQSLRLLLTMAASEQWLLAEIIATWTALSRHDYWGVTETKWIARLIQKLFGGTTSISIATSQILIVTLKAQLLDSALIWGLVEKDFVDRLRFINEHRCFTIIFICWVNGPWGLIYEWGGVL
jgi:hypothetical protein